ncbi:MAG: aminotransferase class I/II-fold pyridoxal phosphate-dependent enzyme [Planctomycetes bacterium]|nr:aminotransferase class I/II-fold pyridoxal phosphate-dependent enzyme [Planctomycetota bacterium]
MYRHGEEEIKAAAEVLKTDHWFRYGNAESGHQQQAATFEKEWCGAFGVKHAGLVSSGTAALMCCYAGLGIGPGDEVIVPGYTWIASATAPLTMGAIPVIVDVDDSLMMDPEAVEKAIGPRTKAICPVHMAGLACDMERILDIAARHKLYVIEDSCQCDGGVWSDGRKMGTLGDMGAYSFNVYKVIACGDGGLFSTDDEGAFQRALIFHDAGIGFRSHASELKVPIFAGLNLRGNEILAAVMRVQLGRLEGIISDLHRVHGEISERTADAGVRSVKYNGSTGTGTRTGTGASLGFRFGTEKEARRFAAAFAERAAGLSAGAFLPIDSGRHVYSNWEAVMKKRAWHTDAMNPYNHPANAGCCAEYSPDMLPRTLEILKTSVVVGTNPDWTERDIDAVAAAVRAAAARG